ncbi:MAG: swarming motility protein YbiA, partial [Flavobacteriales bacterium]|nr:swarming motility protein YbiA [Flavobacteriales bacterium]
EGPKKYLLSTGDRELVEHTTRDSFWGDGGDGTGANQLGKGLMRIRTQLREWARFD